MPNPLIDPIRDVLVAEVAEAAGGGTGFGVPLFVGREQTAYTTNTSVVVDVPASAETGDLLVLFVMSRDTITAPSDNGSPWTQRGTMTEGASGFDQTVTVMTAVYDEGYSDVTVTQDSSQRMSAGILALRSDSGFAFGTVVQRLDANGTDVDGLSNYTWATVDNNLLVPAAVFVCTSWAFAPIGHSSSANALNNNAPHGTNQCSLMRGTSTSNQNRMVAFYKYVPAETATGAMTSGCTTITSDNEDGVVTVAFPIAKG